MSGIRNQDKLKKNSGIGNQQHTEEKKPQRGKVREAIWGKLVVCKVKVGVEDYKAIRERIRALDGNQEGRY